MMVAMTIGHLAWAFVPTDTALSEVLHFIGRLTIPLACFLVVLGFELTHDVWAYARRLFAFGVLAQIPYAMFGYPLLGDEGLFANPWHVLAHGNVLFTLGFGLLTLITLNKMQSAKVLAKPSYIVPIVLFALCASWSDWGLLVVFWVVGIYYGKKMGSWAVGFTLMTIFLFLMSFLLQDNPNVPPYIVTLNTQTLMDYGVFLAVPIMIWYERNNCRSPKAYRLPRLMFYWYYVTHLAILGLVLNIWYFLI